MNNKKKNQILFPDKPNGIFMYEYPMINGIKQYIQIRGTDRKNPLLLFLHGGPGGSVAGLCHALQAEWENRFTVVNWDQRNSCKTYLANKADAKEIAKSGSMENYLKDISDAIAYLHTVYDFDKLILMGFSWGSIIGAEYARIHPEQLLIYIGVGQIVNFRDGLGNVYEQLKQIISENGSAAEQKKLDAVMSTVPKENKITKEFMKALGSYSMLCAKYISKNSKPLPFSKLVNSPFMTFKEKLAMLNSDFTLQDSTYSTMMEYDFRADMSFSVPIAFISGEEDPNSPVTLLQECFENISAPDKKIVVIPKAGHCCFNDKQEDFYTELCRLIDGLNA